jgi:hypothetical protein
MGVVLHFPSRDVPPADALRGIAGILERSAGLIDVLNAMPAGIDPDEALESITAALERSAGFVDRVARQLRGTHG